MTDTTTSTAVLRAWPPAQKDELDIATVLGRIQQERGHFRHLTASSLHAEAASGNDLDGDSEDRAQTTQDTFDDTIKPKTHAEKLQQAKLDMLSHISTAQNEALMALDFVSLVLSKDMPRQAEQTMSPFLKQQIAPGTLGLDMWQNMQPDKHQGVQDKAIARGWRMNMLQQSADSLLDAASRLQDGVRKETEYWKQILAVTDAGWPVCRMSRGQNTLGVRFGFTEARGEFQVRGLAALRADRNGHVAIDSTCVTAPLTVRVRIMRDGQVVGVSRAPQRTATNSTDIDAKIRQARDAIFEEELFHEMLQETRLLRSSGVEVVKDAIRIPRDRPVENDSRHEHVLIDMIPVSNVPTSVSLSESQSADIIAMSCRLLLSNEHRRRFEKRSQAPAALSASTQPLSTAFILRPVIAAMQHYETLDIVNTYAQSLKVCLASAGVHFSIQKPMLLTEALTSAQSATDLAAFVIAPLRSSSKMALAVREAEQESVTSTADEISIQIITDSHASPIRSSFDVNWLQSEETVSLLDIGALKSSLDYKLASILASQIASRLAGWKHVDRQGTITKSEPDYSRHDKAISISVGHRQNDHAPNLCISRGDKTHSWSTSQKPDDRDITEMARQFADDNV